MKDLLELFKDGPVCLTELREFIESSWSEDVKIHVDMSMISDADGTTAKALGDIANRFRVHSVCITPGDFSVITHVSRRLHDDRGIKIDQVLTVQDGHNMDVVEDKIGLFVVHAMKDYVLTVEILHGVFNAKGEQCYLVKDGHHGYLAAKDLCMDVHFQVEEDDEIVDLFGLLTNPSVLASVRGADYRAIWLSDFADKGSKNEPIPELLKTTLVEAADWRHL